MNYLITLFILCILYPYFYRGMEQLVFDIAYSIKYIIYLAALVYITIVKWWRNVK